MNNGKLALIQEYRERNRAKNYTNELIREVNENASPKMANKAAKE